MPLYRLFVVMLVFVLSYCLIVGFVGREIIRDSRSLTVVKYLCFALYGNIFKLSLDLNFVKLVL